MAERWLTDDEQRVWRNFLSLQTQLNAAMHRQLQQECGLSLADYQILVTLSEQAGGYEHGGRLLGHEMRIFELHRVLGWEQSRLSHQLRRMRIRDLIVRHESSQDKRGATVGITATGAAALAAAAPGHVELVRTVLFDPMTSDQLEAFAAITNAALQRIAALESITRP
jgi:DNA-binding MarR family transcriptional regulator